MKARRFKTGICVESSPDRVLLSGVETCSLYMIHRDFECSLRAWRRRVCVGESDGFEGVDGFDGGGDLEVPRFPEEPFLREVRRRGIVARFVGPADEEMPYLVRETER